MRKFHRWITVLIAIPMLFIAITGLASQLVAVYARGGLAEPPRRPPAAAPAPAKPQASTGLGFVTQARAHEGEDHDSDEAPVAAVQAPAGQGAGSGPAAGPGGAPMMRFPPPSPAQRMVGYLHHLHSGEEFGPIGTIISILSGCALIFFAISGMWMYLQMFLNRRRIGRKGVFWK